VSQETATKIAELDNKTTNIPALSRNNDFLYNGQPVVEGLDPTDKDHFGKQFVMTPTGLQDVTGKTTRKPPEPSTAPDVPFNYSEGGVNKVGVLDRKTGNIREVTTPGGGTAGPKLPELPAAMKSQGTSAVTALKQVDNITKIITEHPDLIGPFAGRAQEFFQGVGKNPFVGTANERLGAQLAEHLNALFAQELRSMFPGRTNEQMQEIIKSTSARMKQDPNLMIGFLEGIKTNEGIVLNTLKAQGFVEDVMNREPAPKNLAGPTPTPHDDEIMNLVNSARGAGKK
jgi:hypothetical protein